MKKQAQHEPRLVLGTISGSKQPFALTGSNFNKHKHIMGISGSGKSYFLASIALLLFSQGISFCLLDPHGDLARLVLSLLAQSGYFQHPQAFRRLWYVDFSRTDAYIPFNILNQPYPAHTVANNLLEAMHRAFPISATTANLDNVILAASLVLIENQRSFTDINRLILDVGFREQLLRRVRDPLVLQFFQSKFSDKGASASLIDSTLRRSFLMSYSPALRYSLGQQRNSLHFRWLMDNQISTIFNLSTLDDVTKRLLGGFIMVQLEQAFLSRADLPNEQRHPYHVIADEFQLWMSNSEVSFSRFLEETRKYGCVFYAANQTFGQLPASISSALQNACSIVMRAGYEDSSKLAQNFYRAQENKTGGIVESFLRLSGIREQKAHDAFANIDSKDAARAIFENLQRQEALVTLDGETTKIVTNSIPPLTVPPAYFTQIEETYARKLLTPVSAIPQELPLEEGQKGIQFPPQEEIEALKAKYAKRRVE